MPEAQQKQTIEKIEDARALLEQSPFTHALGIDPVSWDNDAGVLVMRMPKTPLIDRGRDSSTFHGGAIAALAETVACWRW